MGAKAGPVVGEARPLGLPLGLIGVIPVAPATGVALEGLRAKARRGAALGVRTPRINAAIRRPRPYEVLRVHGPTGKDTGRVARPSANVPRVPNGKEGRVHPPRPLATPALAARIIGPTPVGVARRIARRPRAPIRRKDLLEATRVRPPVPSRPDGPGRDAPTVRPFAGVRDGDATGPIGAPSSATPAVLQEGVGRKVRKVTDVTGHASPMAQDAGLNPRVAPSLP